MAALAKAALAQVQYPSNLQCHAPRVCHVHHYHILECIAVLDSIHLRHYTVRAAYILRVLQWAKAQNGEMISGKEKEKPGPENVDCKEFVLFVSVPLLISLCISWHTTAVAVTMFKLKIGCIQQGIRQQPAASCHITDVRQPQLRASDQGSMHNQAAAPSASHLLFTRQEKADIPQQSDTGASTAQVALQAPLIQELDSAPEQVCQPQQASTTEDTQSSKQWLVLQERVLALEASSRRMERKIDQILEYSRILAQSFAAS